MSKYHPTPLERKLMIERDREMWLRRKLNPSKKIEPKTPRLKPEPGKIITKPRQMGGKTMAAADEIMREMLKGIEMGTSKPVRFEFDPKWTRPEEFFSPRPGGEIPMPAPGRYQIDTERVRVMLPGRRPPNERVQFQRYWKTYDTGKRRVSLDQKIWYDEGEEMPTGYIRHALMRTQGIHPRDVEDLLRLGLHFPSGRQPGSSGITKSEPRSATDEWAEKWAKQNKQDSHGNTITSPGNN